MFIREYNPLWDVDKQRIIEHEVASFNGLPITLGETLSSLWWKLIRDEDQKIIGYGWIDIHDQEEYSVSEISLCVTQDERGRHYGSLILSSLKMR